MPSTTHYQILPLKVSPSYIKQLTFSCRPIKITRQLQTFNMSFSALKEQKENGINFLDEFMKQEVSVSQIVDYVFSS